MSHDASPRKTSDPIPSNPIPVAWFWALVGGLALLAAINGLLAAHVIPLGDAPDEVNHLRLIAFIADHHRLPILNRDISLARLPVIPDPYVTHPPGGYVLSALIGDSMPATRREMGMRCGSLLAVLLAIPFLAGAARLAFPRSAAMQVCVPLCCLMIPQVTFVSAYANSDAFGLLAGAVLTYGLCLGALRGWTVPAAGLFGFGAGVVVLSRYNAFALLPVFGVAMLASQWRKLGAWAIARNVAVAAAVAGAVAGPWIAFNLWHYHEVFPIKTLRDAQTAVLGHPYATLRDHRVGYKWVLLHRDWLSSSFQSFYGKFGYMSISMPEWAYGLFRGVVWLGACGVCVEAARWARRRAKGLPPDRESGFHPLLFPAFAIGIVAIGFLSLHVALTRDYQAQGRYFLPDLTGIVVLVLAGAWAAGRCFSARRAALLPIGVTLLLCGMNVYALAAVLVPNYPPVPLGSLIPQLEPIGNGHQVRVTRLPIGPAYFHALSVSGGSEAQLRTFPMAARLVMRLGFVPLPEKVPDGVEFSLSVKDGSEESVLVDRILRPKEDPADAAFPEVHVDMTRYAGRPITLIFRVGAAGNTSYESAVFVDPRWIP